MTKAEAIQAMREGKKITHSYFSRDEWMTIEHNQIVFENGIRCPQSDFWRWRELTGLTGWNDGYSLYNE